MKGYFSQIARRSTGTQPKGALRPPTASLWAGRMDAAEQAFVEGAQSPATEWPDHFDGNPVAPQPLSRPIAPASRSVITPVTTESHNITPPGSPATPSLSNAPGSKLAPEPPITLQPPREAVLPVSLESPSVPTVVPPVSEHLPPPPATVLRPEAPEIQSAAHLQPQQPPAQPQSPPRLPFQRLLREVGMSEGLIESVLPAAQPSQKPLTPVAPAPPATLTPAAESRTTPAAREVGTQRESLSPEPPLSVLRPTPPPTLQSAKSVPQLLPNLPAQPSPALKAPMPKTELVIGKITVEVVDAAKPSLVVQAPASPRVQASSLRKPHSRPESTLKFGLGQL